MAGREAAVAAAARGGNGTADERAQGNKLPGRDATAAARGGGSTSEGRAQGNQLPGRDATAAARDRGRKACGSSRALQRAAAGPVASLFK
jgi:hypothetical protein